MQIKLTNFINPPNKEGDAASSIETKIKHERQQVFEAIEGRINQRRTFFEKAADAFVGWFGSIKFVVFNFIFFIVWIAINLDFIPGVRPFDPFPFILLTMVVSLEAIFLSVFVLISQNRESKISDLREEFDLQINMIAEQEITKVIHLLGYLMKHLGVQYEKDPELKKMMKPLDTDEIRFELEKQLKLPHELPKNK